MKKRHILLVIGGESSEHNISIAGGENIFNYIDKKKFLVSIAVINRKGQWKIFKRLEVWNHAEIKGGAYIGPGKAAQIIESMNIDLAYLNLHGSNGEDGTIQGFFEILHIPYTGSNVFSASLTMKKKFTNEILKINGFNVPNNVYLTTNIWNSIEKKEKKIQEIKKYIGNFPMVVKAENSGSSIGIEIVNNLIELKNTISKFVKKYKVLLIEEYIKGCEITCGVIKNQKGINALPPTEIRPLKSNFFDFKAKYKKGASLEITPAEIDDRITKKIQKLAIKIHYLLDCGTHSRTDMIIAEKKSKKKIYILEINTIPGMTKTSLIPQQAKASGLSYSKLLDTIIYSALKK